MPVNKTYKDKIRERFLNKKRQASISKSPSHTKPLIVTQVLNREYVREEHEISNILQAREKDCETDSIKQQIEQEISFFTGVIYDPEFETSLNKKSLNGVAVDEQSVKSHDIEDPVVNELAQETPTHLASSYFQIEDLNVVEEFNRQQIDLDEDECFLDASDVMPPKIDVDIENGRKLAAEGLFVPEIPKISKTNKNLLLNRLLEEASSIDALQKYRGPKIDKFTVIDRIIPTFIPPADLSQNVSSYILENKIIRIQIREIYFDNHPLFGEEDILAKRIENLFGEYKFRREHHLTQKLESKLAMLRNMVRNDEEESGETSALKNYRNEIRNLRNLLHRERKVDTELLHKILKSWKELKTLRKTQDYNATSLKIHIKKTDSDYADDQRMWEDQFEMESNEIYNEQLELYYDEKKKIRSIIDNENDEKNMEIIKNVHKPDMDVIRRTLTDNYMSSMRHPGEPKIEIALGRVAKTDQLANHSKQIKRKLAISNIKYFIKLIFDDNKVSRAKEITLNTNFVIDLNAVFTIKLTTTIPEKIELELHEQPKMKPSRKICSIFLPVPDQNELFVESELREIEFTSEKFRNNAKRKDTLPTSGKIKSKIGWIYSSDLNDDDQQTSSKLTNTHKNELQTKLKTWYDDQILDPLDPDNKILMDVITTKTNEISSVAGAKKVFRLNEDLTAFCSEEEINGNQRFKLLQARHEQGLGYTNMKQIPHLDREIEMPENQRIIEETVGMDPIDIQRHRGKKYLKKVYETITHHIKLKHKDHEDCNILIGDEIPTFGSLRMALLEIFGPKRPLKPTRKSQTNRTSCRLNEIQSFTVIVNVERAFGIPTRTEEQVIPLRKNSTISSTPQTFKTINVRPYVSVAYKDKIVRTSTAEGSNPTWNEQLALSINNKLHQIKGSLSIQLFDEYIEDIMEDDRTRATEIYQRISSKWIGELRIPISIIYSNQRIEGIFEVNTPSVLLGYSKTTFGASEQSSAVFGNLPDIRGPTHISLFISVEPILEIEKLNTAGLECVELDQIQAHIEFWGNDMKLEFPDRPQYTTVTLLNGKRVCLTRLIGAINIPFDKNEDTEFLIRRYVSLIPVVHSVDSCVELEGVWLTNAQILNLTCASPKDLGILLTCFYIELGYKAWTMLGYALPSGNCCYVLVKEQNEFSIIDPLTGKKYSYRDTYCPMVTVYSLANSTNIWGNIQKEKRVFMTQFDVTKSREWRPLFPKSIESPNELVHDLTFEYNDSFEIVELQRIIEMKLYKKIKGWRAHRKTFWNRYVGENLQGILLELERGACFDYNYEAFNDKLAILFASYKVNGFPINMPYTNLSGVVERVKGTGIHLISDDNVEFSLAVKVFDYPRNVLSIWVFLVSLVPRN